VAYGPTAEALDVHGHVIAIVVVVIRPVWVELTIIVHLLASFHRTVARLVTDLGAEVAVAVHGRLALNQLLRVEEVRGVHAYFVRLQERVHVAEGFPRFRKAVQDVITG
jgi:hypothetical protein